MCIRKRFRESKSRIKRISIDLNIQGWLASPAYRYLFYLFIFSLSHQSLNWKYVLWAAAFFAGPWCQDSASYLRQVGRTLKQTESFHSEWCVLWEAFQLHLAGSQALTVTTELGQQAERWPLPGESCGLSFTGTFRGLVQEVTSSGWGRGSCSAPRLFPTGQSPAIWESQREEGRWTGQRHWPVVLLGLGEPVGRGRPEGGTP